MNMLQIILLYLTLGISVTWLYDKILQRTQSEEMQFNNIERTFVTTLWPIAIIWTIYTIVRGKK